MAPHLSPNLFPPSLGPKPPKPSLSQSVPSGVHLAPPCDWWGRRSGPGCRHLVVVDEAIAAAVLLGALGEVPAIAAGQPLAGAKASGHGVIQDPGGIANHTGAWGGRRTRAISLGHL